MRLRLVTYVLLGAILAFFIWQSLAFAFYQDDAYISYRYVANYLHGDGLVYNAGERVEGFTNFGWVLGLILSGLLGVDYILVSRLAGIAFGVGTVVLVFLLAERCLERRSPWWSLLPAALVGANLSLAYWAQSGLETAAFVFLTTLSIYLFIARSWLLIAALVAVVLMRPEGALLAGLMLVAEALVYRCRPFYSAGCVGIAFLFSLPFVGFKLAYYGSIVPNPFYAKTSLGLEQVAAGWEYLIGFARDYPLLMVGLILLPVIWPKLNRSVRTVWLMSVGYVLYIVVVGGDVLKVHRFLLPVVPLLALMFTLVLFLLAERLKPLFQYSLLILAALTSVTLGLLLPRDYVLTYAEREGYLVNKMAFYARRLKDIGPTNFSVASTTIGRLGFDLSGHRVIDMLGLTDSTIARHPEPVPTGLESTWRERSFNSPYLLQQAPDFIVFSTGLKPSAPAERALLMYDQFLNCYRGATWYYQPTSAVPDFPLVSAFRRMHPLNPPFEPTHPIEFVNAYTDGCNALIAGRPSEADRLLSEALRLGGDPPYVYLLYRLAFVSFYLKQDERGEAYQNRALAIDSTVAEIQADLYVYEYTVGNRSKAAIHRRWLNTLSPWLIPRYDSVAQARARQYQPQFPATH
jgi:arabinofuranosyltransferase